MNKKPSKLGDDDSTIIELTGDDMINLGDLSDDLVVTKTYNFKEYVINLDSDIEKVSNYRKAFHVLNVAGPNDIVRVVLNTGGGYVDTALQFHNMLLNTQARTIAEVYNAASAGSLIMLSCDNIQMMQYSSVLIHTMSFGIGGKLGDIKAIADFTSVNNSSILTEVYKGFINDKEIEDIINGRDLWLTKEDCEKRFKHWTPIRARKLDEEKSECVEKVSKVSKNRRKK